MPTVTAADNLTIQYDAARWYLYNGRGESEMPAASAAPGGMAYTPAFALSRRLPETGFLPVDQVMIVALGYAAEDSAWHLGVMLMPEAAASRGSRWCGLARWQADDAAAAEPTARALANLWEKPFKLIPPSTPDVQPLPTAEPEEDTLADLPLMPLPILADDWQLRETDTSYQLSRSPDWRRGLLLRAIFFSILAPLFALLSIGALTTPFARVSPEWLPLIGLGIAFLMAGLALWQFRAVRRERVVILDRRGQLVRLTTRDGRRVRMQFPYESADYVLISHVVSRRKPSEEDMATYKLWAEIWIHIYTVRRGFIELAHIHEVEGRALNALSFAEKRPLHFGELDSPAHHIGGWLAHELDVPAYVEER
ncbi:MAG: hypothetical protein DYG88_14870 [Chloroflexi bacterium CFX4]|nr:hypothetical protein [Chloroflexi bacterium CFX4]